MTLLITLLWIILIVSFWVIPSTFCVHFAIKKLKDQKTLGGFVPWCIFLFGAALPFVSIIAFAILVDYHEFNPKWWINLCEFMKDIANIKLPWAKED